MNAIVKGLRKALFNNNPEIDARIHHGIELYRKGTLEIKVETESGAAVEDAELEFRQLRHGYQFGCNGFMINQFDSPERNLAHDKAFSELFNLAVVPFYWSDTEPEDGNPRFAQDSPKVWRRPNTDECLAFCEQYDIDPKGHPLMWHSFIPEWLDGNQTELKLRWEQRVREIAQRYGTRITNWDVINEVIDEDRYVDKLPTDPTDFAFDIARKYLPEAATLNYNDYVCWGRNQGRSTAFYAFVRRLLNDGKKVDCMGLQYHLFGTRPEDMVQAWSREKLNPCNLYSLMDLYASLGLPMNISEVTCTAHEALGDERLEFQADVAERLYQIWFSHPATTGIIYWNLIDDTAYINPRRPEWNENIYKGGLLNNDDDLTPKPVYRRLSNLINQEWHSEGKVNYQADTPCYFRGFYGTYQVQVKTNHGTFTRTIRLEKDRSQKQTIVIGG